jgi:hypothetical protein
VITTVAALCAVLTGLAAGAAVLVGWPAYGRLRYRQAVRRHRIRQIEDAYERDTQG